MWKMSKGWTDVMQARFVKCKYEWTKDCKQSEKKIGI